MQRRQSVPWFKDILNHLQFQRHSEMYDVISMRDVEVSFEDMMRITTLVFADCLCSVMHKTSIPQLVLRRRARTKWAMILNQNQWSNQKCSTLDVKQHWKCFKVGAPCQVQPQAIAYLTENNSVACVCKQLFKSQNGRRACKLVSCMQEPQKLHPLCDHCIQTTACRTSCRQCNGLPALHTTSQLPPKSMRHSCSQPTTSLLKIWWLVARPLWMPYEVITAMHLYFPQMAHNGVQLIETAATFVLGACRLPAPGISLLQDGRCQEGLHVQIGGIAHKSIQLAS